MEDTQFYQRILGLQEPWQVKAVRMDLAKQSVEVSVNAGHQWRETKAFMKSGKRAFPRLPESGQH
jgi:hypothetical protein